MIHPRADQPVVQRRGQSAQIGILRQDLNHGLGFAELLGEADHLLGGQEQKPILLEKWPSTPLHDRVEVILLGRQFLDQGGGRLRRQFGGGGIDDGQHGFLLRGKELVERRLALAPGQVLGNELVDVGVDGEMAGGVDRR